MSLTWQANEEKVITKISSLLPAGYTIKGTGGNDSTQPDGLITSPSGNTFKKIEIKKIPSVAGLQVVVKNINGSLEPNTKTQPAYATSVIELANNHVSNLNKNIILINDEAALAFNAFEQKYKTMNVALFIGTTVEGVLACKPLAKNFTELFTPILITRPKKSGSSRLPKNKYEQAINILEPFKTNTANGKLYLTDKTQITAANNILVQMDNVWINATGEIRQLSVTKNLTTMLSFGLKTGLTSTSFLTDEQLLALVME